MKKTFVTFLFLFAALTVAFAVPAHPGKCSYKQPDGTVVTLELHGDEHFHRLTDAKGQVDE